MVTPTMLAIMSSRLKSLPGTPRWRSSSAALIARKTLGQTGRNRSNRPSPNVAMNSAVIPPYTTMWTILSKPGVRRSSRTSPESEPPRTVAHNMKATGNPSATLMRSCAMSSQESIFTVDRDNEKNEEEQPEGTSRIHDDADTRLVACGV